MHSCYVIRTSAKVNGGSSFSVVSNFSSLHLIMFAIHRFLCVTDHLHSLHSNILDRRPQTSNIARVQLSLVSFQGQSVCDYLRFCAIGHLSVPNHRLV